MDPEGNRAPEGHEGKRILFVSRCICRVRLEYRAPEVFCPMNTEGIATARLGDSHPETSSEYSGQQDRHARGHSGISDG
jgi:hypothetical protein